MALSLTEMKNQLSRMKSHVAKVREKAEEGLGAAKQSAEVIGTAAALSYANARFGDNGEIKVLNVPIDLAAGIGLKLGAFLGAFGKYDEDGHNVSDGALASAACRISTKMGQEHKSSSTKGVDFAGALNAPPGYPSWSNPVREGVHSG